MHPSPRLTPHLLLSAFVSTAVLLVSGCGSSSTASTSVSTTPTPTPAPTQTSCTTPAATISHTGTAASTQQFVVLDRAKYPQALCNDGSAAAYVLRPGQGAASTRWVLSLQGGGECYDQTSCANRAASMPNLVSTTPYQLAPSTLMTQGGVQGATIQLNPDFYDATQVTALYCSSDDWSGARASNTAYSAVDPTTWNFQGHAILQAVVADLKANHGLGAATEVLFTGQSAGGVGVFANVNTLAALVPTGVRFVAWSDAAFPDGAGNFLSSGAPPNYVDTVNPSNQIAKRITALPLWNGTGDAPCNAAASNITAQINCYSGQTLLAPGGTVTLPMLVSTAEKDTNQLGTAGIPAADINSGSFTLAETGYISYFAAQMRAGMAATNANVSLFSPDAFIHEEGNDPILFTTAYGFPNANSLTLQQEVGTWYRAPCTAQRNIAN